MKTIMALGLVIYGSCLVGAHSKWQLGVAAFVISLGHMIHVKELHTNS